MMNVRACAPWSISHCGRLAAMASCEIPMIRQVLVVEPVTRCGAESSTALDGRRHWNVQLVIVDVGQLAYPQIHPSSHPTSAASEIEDGAVVTDRSRNAPTAMRTAQVRSEREWINGVSTRRQRRSADQVRDSTCRPAQAQQRRRLSAKTPLQKQGASPTVAGSGRERSAS